ncbi:MAG: aspartyl protease family protein, partial [Spirochaetaceae bacterium]|nr:aspartyl protease family protein [Spirochaetaceae bacterium]
EKEIRSVTTDALVDTGCMLLVITEAVREKLGLSIQGLRRGALADGSSAVCRLTEPIEIHWNNRDSVCRALVVPGADKVLLGAIPLEDMDLIVDPVRQQLTGAHGDEIVAMLL